MVALDEQRIARSISESKQTHGQLGSWVEGYLQQQPSRRPTALQMHQQGLVGGVQASASVDVD